MLWFRIMGSDQGITGRADRQPGVFKKHFQAESMGAADASPPTHHSCP